MFSGSDVSWRTYFTFSAASFRPVGSLYVIIMTSFLWIYYVTLWHTNVHKNTQYIQKYC